MKKVGTVALLIGVKGVNHASLEAIASDDEEIQAIENSIKKGGADPIQALVQYRRDKQCEQEEFADYVETLLTRSFVSPSVQEQGVRWLQSKIKIEEYEKTEKEATQVIAEYAFKVYLENPDRVDFLLSGPKATVRIRIFEVGTSKNTTRQVA